MTEAVRQAFRAQADACQRLGSPFTARLCTLLADRLDHSTPVGAAVLRWPEDPGLGGDVVPLRLAGALHALARSGRAPDLTAAYPPRCAHRSDGLWAAIEAAFTRDAAHFEDYLAGVPQTNEVGRSAAIIGGLLTLAQRFGRPLALYEIGASAGLNLIPERFHYRFGVACWGDADAPVRLAPDWRGPPPPTRAALRIGARRGADLRPLDLGDAAQRARLLSYIWPDQSARLARTRAAITLVREAGLRVDEAEAADWVERHLHIPEVPGATPDALPVLYHAIAWQYFPRPTQERIVAHLERLGRISGGPLAWLRYEVDPARGATTLRLRTWPSGEDDLLARGDPHANWIEWLAEDTVKSAVRPH